MKFEWDDNKNRVNNAKHDVDFSLARKAFQDQHAVLEHDGYVDGEERWQLIALVGSVTVIVVVHTYRGEENGEEIIRVISARPATQPERRRYNRARLG